MASEPTTPAPNPKKPVATIASNELVQLTLAEYVNLLFQSRRDVLKNQDFSVITQDQFSVIKQAANWDHLVVCEPLDQDSLDYMKQLGVIHTTENKERYFKMVKIDVWLENYKAELKLKEKQSAERDILIRRLQRIKEATFILTSKFAMDLTTAQYIMEKMILTGNMPDFAKALDVEDLVIQKPLI